MIKNLKVRVKIFILTTTLTLMMLVIGGIGVFQLNKADERMQKMYNENFSSVLSLNNSINEERSIETSIYKIILNYINQLPFVTTIPFDIFNYIIKCTSTC